jgi:hypothetical protein
MTALAAYPVVFDVPPPPVRFSRQHAALRVALILVLGFFGITLGWLFALVYLALPLIAAVAVARRGPGWYLREAGDDIENAGGWLLGLFAYLSFLSDDLPTMSHPGVRFSVRREGTPTIAAALWRILGSLPLALLLAFLALVSGLCWFATVFTVLANQRVWAPIWQFQRALLRYVANLLAYQASLVERYPPIALDMTPAVPGGTVAAPRA